MIKKNTGQCNDNNNIEADTISGTQSSAPENKIEIHYDHNPFTKGCTVSTEPVRGDMITVTIKRQEESRLSHVLLHDFKHATRYSKDSSITCIRDLREDPPLEYRGVEALRFIYD